MELMSTDFPCYYIDSNAASKRAQNTYKGLVWFTLLLMLTSTILVSIDPLITAKVPHFDAINGAILFLSGLVTVYLNLRSPERRWYLGRAIAESIKTLSWRYMMHAEPFVNDDDKADLQIFTDRILAINKQANKGKFIPKPNKAHNHVITPKMEEIRALTYDQRKAFYAANRIAEQIEWYGNKSEKNGLIAKICTIIIIICQFLAAIYLFEFIEKIKIVNVNNILIFLATSVISIVELNKYKEIYQSYALTKQELNIIRTKFRQVKDDTELNEFVLEAEQAISREHTMWLARRGNADY